MLQQSKILSISVFEPSCKYGVIADSKICETLNVGSCQVITALCYGNLCEGVDWLTTEHIIKQIQSITKRHSLSAIKIGSMCDIKTMHTLVLYLQDKLPDVPIIWSPILDEMPSNNESLHSEESLWMAILKNIRLLVISKQEALSLFKTANEVSLRRLIAQRFLSDILLVDVTTLQETSLDILVTSLEKYQFEGSKHNFTENIYIREITATAVSCYLSKGTSSIEACRKAKDFSYKFEIA